MQRDAQIRKFEASGPCGSGNSRARSGKATLLVTDGFGVVIALEQEDGDAGLGEPRDLAVEEKRDGGVAPVAVENIAGENGEGDFFLQRAVDQGLERPRGWRSPRRAARFSSRRLSPLSGLPRCRSAAWRKVKRMKRPAAAIRPRQSRPEARRKEKDCPAPSWPSPDQVRGRPSNYAQLALRRQTCSGVSGLFAEKT